MEGPTSGQYVRGLHQDLARKYTSHASEIETAWRSFDKGFKAGAADGAVLKHPLDTSLGAVYMFVPELNLRDITEPGSDFLLDLLKYRATTSLDELYCYGINDEPGDYEVIVEMVQKRGLRHANDFKNHYTYFSGDKYGESCRIKADHDEVLAQLAPAIEAGVFVPRSIGELILQRQINLLQVLNIVIDDILDMGSPTRNKKQRTKDDKTPTEAMSSLHLQDALAKMELSDLVASARDQKASLKERVELFSLEPVVLAHAVNISFFSRPELVADEKGRVLAVHTDKYISASFFDAIHGGIQAAAIWGYITRLIDLLGSSGTDKTYRSIILQELSNVCHLEYSRAQALFKRHVSTGTGAKRFKRISNVHDNLGNARVILKGKPEELTRTDPQLHYVLRLCQPETTAAKAIDWIKKLSDLYGAHPLERERLEEREADALCDLVAIIAFIQDLSSVVSVPAGSRKKGQAFVARSQGLEAELAPLKKEIDLRDFAAPIDNLLEPGMAEGALDALEKFIIEKSGTKLGFLYQDLIEDCVSDLQTQYQSANAQKEQDANSAPPPILFTQQPPEERIKSRRQKEKTRPSQSSSYELSQLPDASPVEEAAQILKVSTSTAEVFTKLFKKSESRSSVPWASFEAAMAELGFSVFPKYGSVYTFQPPDNLAVRRPLTVHRPHKPQVEGYRLLILARRLKRVYGWSDRTFEVV